MKDKKYHTVGTVPKSNRKIVEKGKIDTPSLQDRLLMAWYKRHCNKSGEVKLVLWAQNSPLSEMMRSSYFDI